MELSSNCMSQTRWYHCFSVLKLESVALYTSLIRISASYIPKEAFTKDVLFFWPLESILASSSCAWYSGSQPVGKNTLEQKLSRIYTLAGIEGRITNHIAYEPLRLLRCTKMGYLRKSSKKGRVTVHLKACAFMKEPTVTNRKLHQIFFQFHKLKSILNRRTLQATILEQPLCASIQTLLIPYKDCPFPLGIYVDVP